MINAKLHIILYSMADLNQGPLADMDLSLHDFSFCGWPQVVWELSVATIMNLAWIQRYQMKDMDILFPLVPYNPILSKWLGHSDLAKLGVFLVFIMIPSCAGNLHSNPDFQIHTIQRWSHLKTWNQSLVILNIPNFNPMKEALWYSHPLSRYLIFSDGPRLYLQKKEWYVHIVRGPCYDECQTHTAKVLCLHWQQDH